MKAKEKDWRLHICFIILGGGLKLQRGTFTSSFWRESQNAASSWPIPATPKFTFLLMVPSELVPINNAGRYNARGTKPDRSHFVRLQFSRMIYLKNIYKLLFVLLQQT